MAASVLVIEDNKANLELMVYLLKAYGHQPLLAGDGESGLELAAHKRPDVVLCDLQLPGIDGFDVVRILKDDPRLHGVPVVAVTALAMVGDREKALAAGFDGYISKPINPRTFVTEVEQLIAPELRAPRSPRL